MGNFLLFLNLIQASVSNRTKHSRSDSVLCRCLENCSCHRNMVIGLSCVGEKADKGRIGLSDLNWMLWLQIKPNMQCHCSKKVGELFI